jgi:hypothetical protein
MPKTSSRSIIDWISFFEEMEYCDAIFMGTFPISGFHLGNESVTGLESVAYPPNESCFIGQLVGYGILCCFDGIRIFEVFQW